MPPVFASRWHSPFWGASAKLHGSCGPRHDLQHLGAVSVVDDYLESVAGRTPRDLLAAVVAGEAVPETPVLELATLALLVSVDDRLEALESKLEEYQPLLDMVKQRAERGSWAGRFGKGGTDR